MTKENNLPPVPQPIQQPPPPMSNALGIWAVIFTFTGCCSPLGLILGIIGICKYPEGSAGRVLCIIATVISVLLSTGSLIFHGQLPPSIRP